ncbi:ABC-2 type transport system ATP-binding protein [Micromonospora pallida]|uniref:ABC-2 type transport system ATP-binding protein n=1 Tax=Micromonospora pallida TaxID=145854 RepID=A0A1C6TK36_9ACTN|nr:ATP-binding cassette domain-containing protein [Micromonospora pallida]SCL42121.1 ABC-2 type transport system ATP-binding protein [Micromonospora pallida]
MTAPGVLEVDDVTFTYGKKTVLSHVCLDLAVGVTVLLGRNGAGKTTLIRTLAGAARPTAGQVRLAGSVVDGRVRRGRSALRDIGWLPQAFGYPPHMTTREFVTYAAWLKEVPADRIGPRTADALDLVGLTEKAEQHLRALSGGQLRRAGLAAAIAADPAVLILDEPTAGLDPEQRDGFHDLIRRLRAEKTVVVATHLLEDVEALAGRIVVLDAGAVLWTGTAEELAGTAAAPPGLHGLRQGFQTVLGQDR